MSLQCLKVSFMHWGHVMPSLSTISSWAQGTLSLLLSQSPSPRMCTPPPNSAVNQKLKLPMDFCLFPDSVMEGSPSLQSGLSSSNLSIL